MGAPIQEGTTNVSVIVKVIDATTGIPDQALAFGDFAYWYRREVDPGSTPLAVQDTFTEVTQTVTGAHADHGIVHLEEGNYRIDVPDAAFGGGAIAVIVGAVVSGKIVIEAYHPIVAYDPMDIVRLGLTALPDAVADGALGLPISDAGGLDLDTKLANTNEITVARMGALTDWIDAGRLDAILDIIAADVINIDGIVPADAAAVNAQVLDVMVTDTFGEPAQGAPGATISMEEKISWIFAFLRNKKTSTASLITLRNDADSGDIAKRTISDNGTTYTEEEIVTG